MNTKAVRPMTFFLGALDSQLERSFGVKPSWQAVFEYLLRALSVWPGSVAVSESMLWESPGLKSRALMALVEALVSRDDLQIVTQYVDQESFLDGKRYMYRREASRYPQYFGEKTEKLALMLDAPRRPKSTDTTSVLKRRVDDYLRGEGAIGTHPSLNDPEAQRLIESADSDGEGIAMTLSRYGPLLAGGWAAHRAYEELGHVMSVAYMIDYANQGIALPIVGLPGFGAIDRFFPKSWMVADAWLAAAGASSLGLPWNSAEEFGVRIAGLMAVRDEPGFVALSETWVGLVEAADPGEGWPIRLRRRTILERLALDDVQGHALDAKEFVNRSTERLDGKVASVVGRQSDPFINMGVIVNGGVLNARDIAFNYSELEVLEAVLIALRAIAASGSLTLPDDVDGALLELESSPPQSASDRRLGIVKEFSVALAASGAYAGLAELVHLLGW